jgi:hypothetical protein
MAISPGEFDELRNRVAAVEARSEAVDRRSAVHEAICAERYAAIHLEQERTVSLVRWVLGVSAVGLLIELGRLGFPDLIRVIAALH